MDSEDQLRARLAAHEEIAGILGSATTTDGAVEGVMRAVVTHLGWTRAYFWRPDATGALRVAVHVRLDGNPDAFDDASFASAFTAGVGLPGRVWADGEPAWIEDLGRDANFTRKKVGEQCDVRSGFAFPLRLDRKLLGVTEFFRATPTPRDPSLLTLMASVGRNLGHLVARIQAEEINAAVMEVALDAIVSMDDRARIVAWNPAAEKMFGFTRVEAIGRELAELIVPHRLRAAHHAGVARYLATGEAHVLGRRLELVALRRDGSELPVELAIARVGTSSPPIFTGFIRDISAQKKVAADREALLQREQAAREAAERDRAELARANQLKDDFLATVSHELRTPLQAILGWAGILRSTADPTKVQRAVAVIERNAEAQSHLIADILDVSRIAGGLLTIERTRVDVAATIAATVEALRPTAAAKGVSLSLELPERLPSVDGDRSRLEQVLFNLCSNGLKFTPEGGRVEVRASSDDTTITIVIRDTGEGIPPEFLPAVFERFRQADAKTTRRHGGLGLGLAIVRHLVELHGGTVRADSPGRGQGATFTVTLPITSAPAIDTRVATPAKSGAVLSGIRLLVVDDHDDARELLREVLERAGAVVSTASNARDALDARDRGAFDIVLTDLGMPEIDGYELLRRWRVMERETAVPFIALTAFASAEEARRALAAGFSAFVRKPVTASKLVAHVLEVRSALSPLSPPRAPDER